MTHCICVENLIIQFSYYHINFSCQCVLCNLVAVQFINRSFILHLLVNILIELPINKKIEKDVYFLLLPFLK